jgi:hypothetical protein
MLGEVHSSLGKVYLQFMLLLSINSGTHSYHYLAKFRLK